MDALDLDKLVTYICAEFDVQRQVVAKIAGYDKASASPPIRKGLRQAYRNKQTALQLAKRCFSNKGIESFEILKTLQTIYRLPEIPNSHIGLLKECSSGEPDNETEERLLLAVLAYLIQTIASVQDASSEELDLGAFRQMNERCSLPIECINSHIELLSLWNRQTYMERNKRTAIITIDEVNGTISRALEITQIYRNPKNEEIDSILTREVARDNRTNEELIDNKFQDLKIKIDGLDYSDKLSEVIIITPRDNPEDSINDTTMQLCLPIDESKESMKVEFKYTTVSSLADPKLAVRMRYPVKEINHNYFLTNDDWEIALYSFTPFYTLSNSLVKKPVEYYSGRTHVQFRKETWSLPGTGYTYVLSKRD